MGLADTFDEILEQLPPDWTDLVLDVRLKDESQYIPAATYMVTCNAQPYSRADWHWRIPIAHAFGHAASAPTVHGTLKLLDDAGIDAEMRVAEVRAGRTETTYEWGRPESWRQEHRRLRMF